MSEATPSETASSNRLKMYCVVSREALKLMNGNRGKFGTQAGHAYLHAFIRAWNEHHDNAEAYINSGRSFKITLAVDTTAELLELHEHYQKIAGTALIEDAGFTVFNEPTVTCLGIGPIYDSQRCEKLSQLRLLI